MKPSIRGIAASLVACMMLALLPACGTTRQGYEPAPHYVTVVEADGTMHSMRADDAGVASVERAAFGELAAGMAIFGIILLGILGLIGLGAAALADAAFSTPRYRDPHHDPYRN